MLMLFKQENLPTQGDLVFGLPVRGGHALYLSKYREEEKVFWLINYLILIKWLLLNVYVFLKGK